MSRLPSASNGGASDKCLEAASPAAAKAMPIDFIVGDMAKVASKAIRVLLSTAGTVSLVAVMAAWLMLPYRETDLAQAGGLGVELDPLIVIPLILALGALIGFVMSRMQFGRKVYAVGANEDAARLRL